MRLAALFGSILCVAVAIPACGSDDDGDDKKTNTGGSGGGVIGGNGGTGGSSASGGTTTGGGGSGGSSASGGSGGSGGGVTTITCGTETCTGYNVVVFEIQPCCPAGIENKCGADVPAEVSDLIGVPAGCYELDQEGPLDANCPDVPISAGGANLNLPGCCNAASGMCGNVLDVSSFGGPNFGCASVPLDGGTPAACGGDSGTGGSAGAAGAAGDAGPADASAD